ncbi:glycoside hydrolase family 3 N-terminal domain-containing protein [Pseudonocardia sp.]|uniref:glycoside hydrolase family 3 N-terminal domain-containing protein n=1 Tax=Pseudonocardia sp. TaxID=60912 RepID=UPI0039C940E6
MRRRLGLVAIAVLLAGGLTVGITQLTRERAGRPEAAGPSAPAAPPGPPACGPQVAAMPLRARLAQRLMVGVNPARPDSARAVVASSGVGGVFIGGNATAILQPDALGPMRAASPLPVAVAVDEEGGRVQRIDQLDGSVPSARVMARTMTPAQVRALGGQRGRELRARGVTVDMAPVLDVDGGPANGAIGDRSFSADPATVVSYAGAFAAGLRDAGVLPVFKHFPGHGRASGDSHASLVSTPPLDALRTDDLVPYRELLGTGPAAVMVGHLNVPGLTGGKPASLSPATYQLLRSELGFQGLVMTDDLGAMRAITDGYALPDAVLAALRAGADVALWTSDGNLGTVLDRLQAAVVSGTLPASNVDEATARILAFKGRCSV